MRPLKQSTQVVRLIGPFLDKTDGVTEETGLAGVGTELSKEGAAFGAGPVLGTHDSDGWYPITLTTTHTNTLGDLTVKVHDAATHLPYSTHFTVMPANAFDALVSGSGVGMRSDVQGWLGTAPATPTTNGVPEVDLTFIAGAAVSTSTAQLGVNVVNAAGTAWGSGAITAGVIAADAIGASELAADAVAEIADAVWDEDATGHQTGGTFGQAIGDPGASTETLYKAIITDPAGTNIAADIIAIKAETAAILDDTDDIGVAGAGLTALATQASVNTIDDFLDTEVAAILAAVDTEVAAILADTNELQTDWADGGRLDLILDARASQTSVDDLPTNAELATALGTADDAVLSAIAALNDFDPAVDVVIANVTKVNGTTVDGAGTEGDPWGPA